MKRPSRAFVLITIAIAVIAVTVAYVLREVTLVLDAPQPAFIPNTVDSLPPLPVSIVEAPVTYDLQTAIDSLEAAVPKIYGDLDVRLTSAKHKRVQFAFLLQRSPFRVQVDGSKVSVSADVEYSGRVWYSPPIGPDVEVSCGTGDDLPRRARLTLETTAELTTDWGLRTQSRVARLEAYSDSSRDRCRLTVLRLDVTERVFSITEQILNEKLERFDARVARWPVRPRFERIWRSLQKPLRLADSVYMTINPSHAQVGSIGANGNNVFAKLRLIAAPRVSTGPKPVVEFSPLPPLERDSDIGRGARVLLDASFTYPVATVMLRKAMVGRTITQAGHTLRIRDVRILGIGGGRVALGIRLSGAVRGRLFFTGTPGYDAQSRQIIVPDLDYDVGSAQVLVKGYEWLNDTSLRDFLREKARLPDSAVVNTLAELAEHGINRKLPARGTELSGRIDRASVIAVRATLEEIRVRALAEADLKLSIDRAPSIPRLREPANRATEED